MWSHKFVSSIFNGYNFQKFFWGFPFILSHHVILPLMVANLLLVFDPNDWSVVVVGIFDAYREVWWEEFSKRFVVNDLAITFFIESWGIFDVTNLFNAVYFAAILEELWALELSDDFNVLSVVDVDKEKFFCKLLFAVTKLFFFSELSSSEALCFPIKFTPVFTWGAFLCFIPPFIIALFWAYPKRAKNIDWFLYFNSLEILLL